MVNLVRAQPALKIEFVSALGLDVLSSMGLLCLVHDFEGLHEWLLETAAALPTRLRHDICLVMRLGVYPYVTIEAINDSIGEAALDEDYAGFIATLKSLSAAECRTLVVNILERATSRSEITTSEPLESIVDDQEQLEDVLLRLQVPGDLTEVVHLYQEPTEWRDLLVSTLTRFWERVYADEYAQQQQQRERNIHYHRTHPYSAHFTELFAAVTGRLLPDNVTEHLDHTSHVRFIPSLYIGPYLAFLINKPLLTVFYNSRATPTEGDEQAERIQSLYQPLAALADKTRLQIISLLRGRELYAQEIVNLLDIHQSAVSRHLKLMETSGVLLVRRDKGAKYYSINRQRIEEISAHLRELA